MGLVRSGREAQAGLNSGDTISIETISHSLGQIKPGAEMDEIVKLRKENDGGGPHSITGPIYVAEAEPGDTLEVRILKMSREEAYALTSIVGDCRVTQVVDIRKGVHCMIPKRIFVDKKRATLEGVRAPLRCWGRPPG